MRGTLPVGSRLRNYELLSVLGHGGFGTTYHGRDTTLGREVAIKEYLPTALAVRENGTTVVPRSTQFAEDFIWGRERFLDEARILATLEGAPAVVRVYDFLEANGTAYMVMGLARGDTLEQRLQREGKLAPAIVQRLLEHLLEGLEAVHKSGFLHRDVKPANIILDAANTPTLIDFGASRASMADRTAAMTAVFTPRYAAAEQLTSDKQGPWTDIYSLSATLYHAITGKAPPSSLERALNDTYQPLAALDLLDYPPGILRGIDAGMALRAKDRPQSIEAWRQILNSSDSSAGDETVFERPKAAAPPVPTVSRTAVVEPLPDAGKPPVTGAISTINRPPARRAGVFAGMNKLVLAGAASAAILIGAGGVYLLFPSQTVHTSVTKSRNGEKLGGEANAVAEARQKAEAEVEAKLKAEADSRQQAEALAKQKADEEAQAVAAAEAERKAEARAKADAEAKALAEAEARWKAGAEARARADAEAKAIEEAEAKRKAEAEAKAKADAEAKAMADAEAKRKAEAEAKAMAIAAAEAKRKAEAEARAKADAEAKAIADAEAKRKADAEAKALAIAAAEAKRKAEAEAKAKADAEAKAIADAEAKRKGEADAKAKADAEAKVLAAAEARRKAEAEAKAIADAEAKAKAESEAKRRAEAEAKAKADAEAKAAAAAEAKRKAEVEAKAKADAETKAMAEADPKRKAEAEAKAKADAEAKAEGEARQRADADAKARADAELRQKLQDDAASHKAAEAGEAALKLSQLDRQRVQVALTSLGFDTQGADGVLGPRSREMVLAWQKARNQEPTGFLTAAQQHTLLGEAAPAIAKYEDNLRKAEAAAKARASAAPSAAAPAGAPASRPNYSGGMSCQDSSGRRMEFPGATSCPWGLSPAR